MKPKARAPIDALSGAPVGPEREIMSSMDADDLWLKGAARAVVEHALERDGHRHPNRHPSPHDSST